VTAGGLSRRLRVAEGRLRDSWAVLGIAAVCLVLAAGGDEWRELGRYDRAALAAGEYWRLVSGQLVHLGWGHLLLNVAALLVIGALLAGVFRTADWLRTAFVSAAAIDAGLWFLEPQVDWYVGLSGVLHGLVAGGAFELGMRRDKFGAILGLAVGAKLVFEQAVGPLPLTAGPVGGPVIVAAHLYGAAGGLAAAALSRVVRRRVSQV
jgi:rhomboid family GlyGly-CTERM serine protease